jgi:hypothetical protein
MRKPNKQESRRLERVLFKLLSHPRTAAIVGSVAGELRTRPSNKADGSRAFEYYVVDVGMDKFIASADENFRIVLGSEFLQKASIEELKYVLVHECTHIAMGHLWRLWKHAQIDERAFFIAVDYEVYRVLKPLHDQGVIREPDGTCVPKALETPDWAWNLSAEEIWRRLRKQAQTPSPLQVLAHSSGQSRDEKQGFGDHENEDSEVPVDEAGEYGQHDCDSEGNVSKGDPRRNRTSTPGGRTPSEQAKSGKGNNNNECDDVASTPGGKDPQKQSNQAADGYGDDGNGEEDGDNQSGGASEDLLDELAKIARRLGLQPCTSQQSAENMRQFVEGALQRHAILIKIAEDKSGQAQGPNGGNVQDFLQLNVRAPVHNWQDELREFVQTNIIRRPDWMRPAKQTWATGVYTPRRQRYVPGTLVICRDTSGSMQVKEFDHIASELKDIFDIAACENIQLLAIDGDTRVTQTFIIDSASVLEQWLRAPKGRGGTEYDQFMEYVKQLRNGDVEESAMLEGDICGMILCTDLEVSQRTIDALEPPEDIPLIFMYVGHRKEIPVDVTAKGKLINVTAAVRAKNA